MLLSGLCVLLWLSPLRGEAGETLSFSSWLFGVLGVHMCVG